MAAVAAGGGDGDTTARATFGCRCAALSTSPSLHAPAVLLSDTPIPVAAAVTVLCSRVASSCPPPSCCLTSRIHLARLPRSPLPPSASWSSAQPTDSAAPHQQPAGHIALQRESGLNLVTHTTINQRPATATAAAATWR